MSNSAWEDQVIVKGAGLSEGIYEVVLKDIQKESKVVQNRMGLAKQQVIGKEYDALTADQKILVDSIEDEYWPQRPTDKEARKKAAFIDQVRFIFNDPATNTDLRFGAVFPVCQYSKDGTVISSSTKSLTDFVTRATGAAVAPGETFKYSDFFKPGDEYVLELIKKGNFTEIDPNSVVKKELAKPIVRGIEALSENAAKLLEYLKANYQGRPKRDVFDLYNDPQFGGYQAATLAWQEIIKNVPYTKDGKTLDFSEAV